MTSHYESGFTLVEVLISLMIFAVGILAVINMQLFSTAYNVKSRGMTEGIVVAQNKIEELSALPYTDADLTDRTTGANVGGVGDLGLDDFPSNDLAVNNADHTDAADPKYTVYWNVQDDAPFNDTKLIRVIVRWQEKGVFYNFPIDMVKSDGA